MSSPVHPSQLQPSAEAERVLAFVNTRKNKLQDDHFADVQKLHGWLVQHHWISEKDTLSEKDLQTTHQLRSALVTLMRAHVDTDAVPAADLEQAIQHLQDLARNHPLQARLSVQDASLLPLQSGMDSVVARILAICTEMGFTGTWHRMKACRNPVCHQAFYDRTRNQAGTFCSQNPCGAQVAMRSYRKRKQAAKTQQE